MTESVYTTKTIGASLSKRELRALAKRLARSDRSELRAVARALDKLASGEVCSSPHHEGHDYDPFRCAACVPDLWVMYAIGVAFPNVDADDLAAQFAGLLGLSCEDMALGVEAGRDERPAPNVTHDWLGLVDGHREELDRMRAGLEPGWYRDDCGRWCRDFDEPDPDPNPDTEAFLAQMSASHAEEAEAFIAARSPYRRLAVEPALIQEIRFGTDSRTARTLKRASLRKGFDSSWLI
jgi:hypothetical protein